MTGSRGSLKRARKSMVRQMVDKDRGHAKVNKQRRIGLVTTPLVGDHAVRGIGFYTKRLFENLMLLTRREARDFEMVQVSGDDLIRPGTLGLSLLHYPFFDLFSPTLRVTGGLPTVVTIHDVIPLRFSDHYPPGIRGIINYYIQKKTLRRVKVVITDSETSKKDIVSYLGVQREQVKVVPLAPQFSLGKPVVEERRLSVRKKYRLPEKFVLYVGDVNSHKNIAGLVRACSKVEIPLVIVGKQAIEIERLLAEQSGAPGPMDLARKILGMPHPQLWHLLELKELFAMDSVIRLGFVPEPDLPAIYSLASVYCQPSFWEGFGLDPLEAISVGCPVVSADIPVLRELLGEAALYVDPADCQSIAEGIGKSLDPMMARRLARLGRKRAANYNWKKTARMTLDVYKESLAEK